MRKQCAKLRKNAHFWEESIKMCKNVENAKHIFSPLFLFMRFCHIIFVLVYTAFYFKTFSNFKVFEQN